MCLVCDTQSNKFSRRSIHWIHTCQPLKSGKEIPLPFQASMIKFQDYSQYNHACVVASTNLATEKKMAKDNRIRAH